MLSGLRTHLMEPELFKEFCEEFTREVNRLRIERRTDQDAWAAELARTEKQIRGIITAIKDGMYQPSMKSEMDALETRKAELTELLANAQEPPPLLHPNMAEIYRQRISVLYESLRDDEERDQAAAAFRTLVEQVTLVPEENELGIVLRGDLAAMLVFAANKKKPDFLTETGLLRDLMEPGALVAVEGQGRCQRVGGGMAAGPAFRISQESVLAGPRNQMSRKIKRLRTPQKGLKAEKCWPSFVPVSGYEPGHGGIHRSRNGMPPKPDKAPRKPEATGSRSGHSWYADIRGIM